MTKPAIIKLDITRSGIVIVCSACPHWYSFRFERIAAWKSAADHEERCHPDRTNARRALDNATRRAIRSVLKVG